MLLQPVVDVVVVASHGAVAFARCRSAAHSGNPSESRDRVLRESLHFASQATGNYLSRHIYRERKISARLTTVPSTLRRPNGTQQRAHHRHRTRDPGHARARATRAATSFQTNPNRTGSIPDNKCRADCSGTPCPRYAPPWASPSAIVPRLRVVAIFVFRAGNRHEPEDLISHLRGGDLLVDP